MILLLLMAVVVPAVILVGILVATRPVSDADLRQAEELAVAEAQQPYVQRDLRRCQERPRQYGADPAGDVLAVREEVVLPQAEWFIGRTALDLREQREAGTGLAVGTVLAVLMLLVGTTFAGHDWASGSMSNQLLFEPRRTRVYLAKAAAVLVVGGLVSLAVLVAYWTGLVVAAEMRDLALPDQAVGAAYKQAVLGAALAGVAGVGGYALTMLLRSTAATLGVLFAVAVAGSVLVGALGFASTQRIQPQANYAAYMVGSYTYVDYGRPECVDDRGSTVTTEGSDCVVRIDRAAATGYWGLLLLEVGVSSLLVFRRRDVP